MLLSNSQLQYHVSNTYHLRLIVSLYTVSKGQGANMLKIGIKRRRTKAQIEQDKEEVILRDLDQQEKMAELEDLRKRI